MKSIGEGIVAMTESQIREIERNGQVTLTVGDSTFDILNSEIEILTEDVPGWLVASAGSLTVALDVTITDELRQEGIARDFVNRIQNLRKDSGFEVTDKIKISLENNNAELADAVAINKNYICQEVQAITLDLVTDLNGSASEIEMDEFLLKVKIEVA